jgi:hypothetical protein
MARTNIKFNNTTYQVDESTLASATAQLQSHLSTVMNGSGAAISLGGLSYNIDSAKLSNATNTFVAHLGTIAGNGTKVVVNGVEYNVDSTKMSGAVADLETVLGGMNAGDNGSSEIPSVITWDGNADGKETISPCDGVILVKVSNTPISQESIIGGEITLTPLVDSGMGGVFPIDENMITTFDKCFGVGEGWIMSAEDDGVRFNQTSLNRGIYFAFFNEQFYCSKLTFPNASV